MIEIAFACLVILLAVCLARWAEHRDRSWLDVLGEMLAGDDR